MKTLLLSVHDVEILNGETAYIKRMLLHMKNAPMTKKLLEARLKDIKDLLKRDSER